MKMWWLVAIFLVAVSQAKGLDQPASQQPDNAGTLRSTGNATVERSGPRLVVRRTQSGTPMTLNFTECQAIGVEREAAQWWVLPTDLSHGPIHANDGLWILPQDPFSKQSAWHLELHGAVATATRSGTGVTVSLDTPTVDLVSFEARPHSDPFGHRFSLQIAGARGVEEALAAFYWGTMLPSIVEKTMAADFTYSHGYVLSTLNVQSYAGSYPAVDHEFQIKGRLAIGSDLDLDVVRRMIELQFRLMQDDPERLYRSPTSVQPDGSREYHIRRDSENRQQNAAMFPLTGNIEVIEESWRYYEARKDIAWLRRHIADLEHAASWTLANTDSYGRVWSDVYYEDQVIKDGRETEAQAFAAHTIGLLATMEHRLGRKAREAAYTQTSRKLAAALIAPLPLGFWDPEHHRFVDWVDRNGKVHDHLPLLANTLPVTFGYATPDQVAAVQQFVQANTAEFERFPSFVAADIAAYNSSEKGTAGPYDLSAAGRYWYWDAAFRASQDQDGLLAHQLEQVAAEGSRNQYFMGERYDMDHVYFVDGKNAHGAEKYYEYPNVFAAVLISKLLGLTLPADADVRVAPHLSGAATVEFDTPAYALRYTCDEQRFSLKNLADHPRRFEVDLSALGSGNLRWQAGNGQPRHTPIVITLGPQQETHWTLKHR